MAPQCDICFVRFDLSIHRPKCLPCGHTICKECVQNPALKKKCPTCRRDLAADPAEHPDNIFVIRLIEEKGGPPRKMPRMEDARVLQLQRGVAAGRRVVAVLQQVVPVAVEALQRHLNSSVADLSEMEEALGKLERGEAAGTAGDADTALVPDLAAKQLQLEESLSLLTTKKCCVVAEDGAKTWRASARLGRFDDILRLLLLQLRADGLLQKVDGGDPALPEPYVGPPGLSIMSINNTADLHEGHLKVNAILRNVERWETIRSLKNVRGVGSERLLRVMAPQLEDLEVSDNADPSFMEEVQKMKSLRRLIVPCNAELWDYPDLPLQLEELSITYPSFNQLRCVQRMPALRSLLLDEYFGPDVAFPPAQGGGLLWLSVSLDVDHKATMLSLIRAHASSLQELHISCRCCPHPNDEEYYFADLGQDLAGCRLQSLRRLVLERPGVRDGGTCAKVDACLLQLRSIRSCLRHAVDVVCAAC